MVAASAGLMPRRWAGQGDRAVPITVASGLRRAPATSEVSFDSFPGAGESGKSTIVKQMK